MSTNTAEGNIKASILQRLDARAKVTSTLLILIGIFLIRSWPAFIGAAVFLLAIARLGRIPPQQLARAVKGVGFLLLFTFTLNALFTPGTTVVSLGPLSITEQGIERGVTLGLRLALIVAATTLLTASTTPLALADGLEYLMRPLRIFRIPVPELAMVTSIALRFIPILVAEAGRITKAQSARGVNVNEGSPVKRAISLAPILVPLFAGALRRADELGDALQARAYVPGGKKGRLHPRHVAVGDVLAVATTTAFVAAIFLWSRL